MCMPSRSRRVWQERLLWNCKGYTRTMGCRYSFGNSVCICMEDVVRYRSAQATSCKKTFVCNSMKDRRSICNFGNQRNGCFFFDGRKKHRGIPAETKHTQIWNAIRLPERSIIVLPDVEQDVEQCTADACVCCIFAF